MADNLLIVVRLVDTASGEIIWQDKLTENLKSYDYIGSYFSKSIMDQFNVRVEESTLKKITATADKNEEVILSLSRGINAFDNKDMETAIVELEQARKKDPESEAAQYYLDKIVTNTAKFKVMAEPYFSYQNPAFLGIMKEDRLFFSQSGGFAHSLYAIFNDMENLREQYSNDILLSEFPFRVMIEYYLPLLSNWGLGVE